MSKEKQIEEMARFVCSSFHGHHDCENCSLYEERCCVSFCAARRLYNAGYRKQRTAQWVTIAETEDGVIQRYTHRCTDCNYFYKTVCPRGDDYCHKCGAKMRGQ